MLSKLIELLKATNHTTALGISSLVFVLSVFMLLHFVPRKNKKWAKIAIVVTIVLGGAILAMTFFNSRSTEALTITGNCNATATGNENQISSRCVQSGGDSK